MSHLLRVTAAQYLKNIRDNRVAAVPTGPATPALTPAAMRNPLGDHWKYDGSRCAALGPEPVTVHFWLEQLIRKFNGQGVTNSVTQGQFMRRLLHGQLRSELDISIMISQMPDEVAGALVVWRNCLVIHHGWLGE